MHGPSSGILFVTHLISLLQEMPANCFFKYVEIKCQLDAPDDFYCRPYCLLNMFRAPLCPSSGDREYYTGDCCLWYLVLWFSSCRYGVELRVMCPHHTDNLKTKHQIPRAAITCIILSSS